MQFKRVTDKDSPEFKEAFEIYKNSFPEFEQRSYADQVEALEHEAYYFQVVQGDNLETLGILCTWETDELVYVEHFAVLASARGKNIGTKILETLKNSTNLPIILEIDPPIDDISIRRRGFYERIGFVMNDFEHLHPPFKKCEEPYPLKILSYPKIGDELYNAYYILLVNTVMYYSEFRK